MLMVMRMLVIYLWKNVALNNGLLMPFYQLSDSDYVLKIAGMVMKSITQGQTTVSLVTCQLHSFLLLKGPLDLQWRWQRWCHQVMTGDWITEVSAGQWPSWPSEKMRWMNVSTLSHWSLTNIWLSPDMTSHPCERIRCWKYETAAGWEIFVWCLCKSEWMCYNEQSWILRLRATCNDARWPPSQVAQWAKAKILTFALYCFSISVCTSAQTL